MARVGRSCCCRNGPVERRGPWGTGCRVERLAITDGLPVAATDVADYAFR